MPAEGRYKDLGYSLVTFSGRVSAGVRMGFSPVGVTTPPHDRHGPRLAGSPGGRVRVRVFRSLRCPGDARSAKHRGTGSGPHARVVLVVRSGARPGSPGVRVRRLMDRRARAR